MGTMRQLKKQILYDVRTACSQLGKWYMISMAVSLLLTWHIYQEYSYAIKVKNLGFSWMDCILGYFRGTEEVSLSDRHQIFRIPLEWFLFHLGYLFQEIKYPYSDYTERGYQYILRSKNRKNWWISKCIWSFLHIGAYFLLFYAVTFLEAYILEGGFLQKDSNIWGIVFNDVVFGEKIILLFVLPYMTAAAFSMLAMTISFLEGPLVAFIVILVLLTASVYWDHPFLTGRYTMLCRYSLLNGMDYGKVFSGMALNGMIMMLSMLIGCLNFNRKEFLEG